jgi:hypothetical protein
MTESKLRDGDYVAVCYNCSHSIVMDEANFNRFYLSNRTNEDINKAMECCKEPHYLWLSPVLMHRLGGSGLNVIED